MSVNAGDQQEGKLKVLIMARSLASYTIKICSNARWFPPEYQTALTNRLIDCAISIFVYCNTANNIRVDGSPDRLAERASLQANAIRECNNLLALMQIAQEVFHLTTKRLAYWGERTASTRQMRSKWRESDSKRFSL